MSGERLRVDASALTLAEHAEAAQAMSDYTGKPGESFYQLAALAWIVRRRTEPDYTYADALTLTMADLELVTDAGEASAADNGGAPPSLPDVGP